MVSSTRPTRLDYCQYLVSSQINYTLTNKAFHSLKFSHDQLNRYLRDDKLTPRLVWEQTEGQIITSPNAYLIFDDTVADKNYSRSIELVRRQWSGNTHSVIRGIGIVTCLYVNPETDQFWLIDYRLFAPDEDGKTKLDHATEMFDAAIHERALEFRCVLMDTRVTRVGNSCCISREMTRFTTALSKLIAKWMKAMGQSLITAGWML